MSREFQVRDQYGDTEATVPNTSIIIPFDSLFNIPQGDNDDERIGRQILVKEVQFRCRLSMASTPTAASTSDLVRVCVVLDKQNRSAEPVLDQATADLLFGAAPAAHGWLAFFSLDEARRYDILFDETGWTYLPQLSDASRL